VDGEKYFFVFMSDATSFIISLSYVTGIYERKWKEHFGSGDGREKKIEQKKGTEWLTRKT
jgi:hypothetical protein